MNERHLQVGAIVVLSLIGVIIGAALLGVTPPIGDQESTPTPIDGPTDGDVEPTPDPYADIQRFSYTIDDIEECGQTCRDVTVTLYNEHDVPASDVTVHTRIYAGENTTDSDDLVWKGERDIGTIEAGGSYTTTERVEVSYWDGLKIQQRDGWITLVTTIESAEATVTVQDTEQIN